MNPISSLTSLFAQAPAAIENGFWFPAPSSTIAAEVDWMFYFILWINIVFFVLILAVMVYFMVVYRRKDMNLPPTSTSHNNTLEVTWSVLPSLLVLLIFYWGFTGFLDLRDAPANSYEIKVTAKKWNWTFTYPNGYADSDLHVPMDRPVKLIMGSDDVLHSLYIPAFRVKQDVVPGRYTSLWFNANRQGEFQLFCTEYCGTKHSEMLAKVTTHPSGEFERWLDQAVMKLDELPPVELGGLMYKRRGCSGCHSIDGVAGTGPSFKGTFGTEQAFADGSKHVIDENYIRESIIEPTAKVRAGFRPVMPTYKGQLRDKQIDGLIEYIKSLKN